MKFMLSGSPLNSHKFNPKGSLLLVKQQRKALVFDKKTNQNFLLQNVVTHHMLCCHGKSYETKLTIYIIMYLQRTCELTIVALNILNCKIVVNPHDCC